MVRLKVLKSIAGGEGWSFQPGQVIEVGPDLTATLLRCGAAEVLPDEPVDEVATVDVGPERPTRPHSHRRRRAL